MATQTIPAQTPLGKAGCSLYRYFDSEGVLLYVGISSSAARRLAEHSKRPWAGAIASVTVESLGSRDDALRVERDAIMAEKPKHNVIHKRAPRPVVTVVSTGTGEVMTDAERKQRERDRRKAGLVLVQAWVPADRAEEARDALQRISQRDT